MLKGEDWIGIILLGGTCTVGGCMYVAWAFRDILGLTSSEIVSDIKKWLTDHYVSKEEWEQTR